MQIYIQYLFFNFKNMGTKSLNDKRISSFKKKRNSSDPSFYTHSFVSFLKKETVSILRFIPDPLFFFKKKMK
jgi:hypothetical protein